MFEKIKNNKIAGLIPPWIFIGVVIILLPVFLYITIKNIKEQKANFRYIMLGKGAAIIRSFEAGVITGIRNIKWNGYHMQMMMSEIVKEPGASYLSIITEKGTIIAHSDPSKIGKKHFRTEGMSNKDCREITWREILTSDGKKIFEVFRALSPLCFHSGKIDRKNKNRCMLNHIIFAGFDISSESNGNRAIIGNLVWQGSIFFFISIAGVFSLFVILAYHNTNALLRKEIAASQRLVSVGKLAAGVAHEIRNPLSSIKGFATYFREKKPDSKEDRSIADIMVKEVERVNKVVGELLEFSTPVKLNKKITNPKQLIENSLLLVKAGAKDKSISIECEFEKELEPVMLDYDKITQVLLNLYLNAIDAAEKDDALKVICKKDQKKKGVKIIISDTGKGISVDDIVHIFDPYFTTKTSGKGIGLANVHNIVKAHDGKIEVKSREGEGTVFTITLPNSD